MANPQRRLRGPVPRGWDGPRAVLTAAEADRGEATIELRGSRVPRRWHPGMMGLDRVSPIIGALTAGDRFPGRVTPVGGILPAWHNILDQIDGWRPYTWSDTHTLATRARGTAPTSCGR